MDDPLALAARIAELSSPLAPRPTTATPATPKLLGIRAVVFDVYGTLLVSASGDISLASEGSPAAAVSAALAAVGIELPAPGEELAAEFLRQIRTAHAASASEAPEVEIREIWRNALAAWEIAPSAAQIERLAVEYECRVNPVWPMPGMTDVLQQLAGSGRTLGIVSNAQFFTPLALRGFTGRDLPQLGFDPAACVWSFAHREAKPGTFLYERCAETLAARGIEPQEALYVGNDMLNDVWPASRVGFRTALFAGDARSLRLREDDPRVAGVVPDAAITELQHLLYILG